MRSHTPFMRAWVLNSVGEPLSSTEVAEPSVRGGGVVVEVLAVHVPAYTGALLSGIRGSVPTPLVLGTGGICRVLSVADDVFGVSPGDVVVNLGLLGSGDAADPRELIIGWTGIGGTGEASATTTRMQALWRDGVFAERALCPKENLVRLPGAERLEHPERLAFLPWLAVAAQGWVRAEQVPGQVVAVVGATGQLGVAAVLVALARGAARVVAVGRNRAALDGLAALDPRVVPVGLTGDRAADGAAISVAGGGGFDVVLDVLGDVPSPDPTLSGYDALATGGTIVLVGGVRQTSPCPTETSRTGASRSGGPGWPRRRQCCRCGGWWPPGRSMSGPYTCTRSDWTIRWPHSSWPRPRPVCRTWRWFPGRPRDPAAPDAMPAVARSGRVVRRADAPRSSRSARMLPRRSAGLCGPNRCPGSEW